MRIKYPRTVQISALNHTGFVELQTAMIEELSKQRKVLDLRIPQSDYAIVTEITRIGHVIKQDYEDNDVILQIELPAALADRMKKYMQKP